MSDEKQGLPFEPDETSGNDDDQARANRLASNVPPTNTPPEPEEDLGERLERLGGEPAPAITPEEFARLQRQGQVHIDSRGRVRTASRSGPDAGVSLRKRRAWYG